MWYLQVHVTVSPDYNNNNNNNNNNNSYYVRRLSTSSHFCRNRQRRHTAFKVSNFTLASSKTRPTLHRQAPRRGKTLVLWKATALEHTDQCLAAYTLVATMHHYL